MDEQDAVDHMDLQSPDPEGIVRMTLRSGRDLVAADASWTGGEPTSSDPYVVVEAGQHPWRSPTIKQNLNPRWSKQNTNDIMIYSTDQEANFIVYDEDWGPDDLIGKAESIQLSQFMFGSSGQHVETTIPLEPQGWLCFTTQYLKLCKHRPSQALIGNQLYFCAKVRSAEGLPAKSEPPFTLRITIGDSSLTTNGSYAEASPAPVAEELKNVIRKLRTREFDVEAIAEMVGLTAEQVNATLDPKSAERALEQAAKERAASFPTWNEVVRLLVPWSEKLTLAKVKLELLDTRKKLVATGVPTTIGSIIEKSENDEHFKGPFNLDHGIKVRASFRTKWLEHAADADEND